MYVQQLMCLKTTPHQNELTILITLNHFNLSFHFALLTFCFYNIILIGYCLCVQQFFSFPKPKLSSISRTHAPYKENLRFLISPISPTSDVQLPKESINILFIFCLSKTKTLKNVCAREYGWACTWGVADDVGRDRLYTPTESFGLAKMVLLLSECCASVSLLLFVTTHTLVCSTISQPPIFYVFANRILEYLKILFAH